MSLMIQKNKNKTPEGPLSPESPLLGPKLQQVMEVANAGSSEVLQELHDPLLLALLELGVLPVPDVLRILCKKVREALSKGKKPSRAPSSPARRGELSCCSVAFPPPRLRQMMLGTQDPVAGEAHANTWALPSGGNQLG